jgi:internalin A
LLSHDAHQCEGHSIHKHRFIRDRRNLSGLRNLTTLSLYATSITDAGLKELSVLKHLTILDLGGTKITDAGLKELSGFKNLKSLTLLSTSTTNVGAAELRKALPTVEIYQ